ncbi:MAG: alpha/beta hydrolase [Byssovorax sp.]
MIAAPLDDTTIRLPSGRNVAFTTWGEPAGGVVLYLHGTGHSRLFCPDPEETARAGVHLVAVDRPGYGRSDPHRSHTLADVARDLVALADHLGIEHFSVIGWSGGAWYAAALAAVAGARVVGAAIVAGGAGPYGEVPGLEATLRPDQREILACVRREGGLAATEAALALPSIQAEARGPQALAELVPGLPPGDRWLLADDARRASFDAAAREAYRQGAEGVVSDRIARFLPWGFRIEDLAMEVNLFLAAEDAVFPPSRADDWIHRLPRARVICWPDAGHLGLAKHWGEVLASIHPERCSPRTR